MSLFYLSMIDTFEENQFCNLLAITTITNNIGLIKMFVNNLIIRNSSMFQMFLVLKVDFNVTFINVIFIL